MTGVKVFIAAQILALASLVAVITWMQYNIEEQRERDCLQSLETRGRAADVEIATWEDVQDISGNDPESAAKFDDLFDRIRDRYDALPPPAACED